MIRQRALLCLIVVGFAALVRCDTEQEEQILADLLDGYDADVRPHGTGDAVTIETQLYIRTLREAGDSGLFDITYTLRQFWHDPRLAFDQEDDAPDHVSLNPDQEIWMPDTFFSRGIEEDEDSDDDDDGPDNDEMIRIHKDGSVTYSQKSSGQLKCPMDFSDFPFDEQRCGITLGSYGSTSEDIMYTWKRAKSEADDEDFHSTEYIDEEGNEEEDYDGDKTEEEDNTNEDDDDDNDDDEEDDDDDDENGDDDDDDDDDDNGDDDDENGYDDDDDDDDASEEDDEYEENGDDEDGDGDDDDELAGVKLSSDLDMHLRHFYITDVDEDEYCMQKTSTGSYSCARAMLHLSRHKGTIIYTFSIPMHLTVVLSWLMFILPNNQWLGKFLVGLLSYCGCMLVYASSAPYIPDISEATAVHWHTLVCVLFITAAILLEAIAAVVALRDTYKADMVPIPMQADDLEQRAMLEPQPTPGARCASRIDALALIAFPALFVAFTVIYIVHFAL